MDKQYRSLAESSVRNVLFLGYDESRTEIISELKKRNIRVTQSSLPIQSIDPLVNTHFDLVISYGYKSILSAEDLRNLDCTILNLHISYLPWNRGSHPNFWAHFDNTPSGVTIHLVNEGLDTGDIVFQKFVLFDNLEKTFKQTYDRLHKEMELLFLEHIEEILKLDFVSTPQRGKGSYHRASDLPKAFNSWDCDIDAEISRLDEIVDSSIATKLAVIDKIEQVRTANNVNWMDLLRIVARKSPADLNAIAGRIRESDQEIFDLFIELSE